MNLTKEQLLQNADAMRAFAEGKPIQYMLIGAGKGWTDYGTQGAAPGWLFGEVDYRPKPEPKTRPWSKPDDVPLNCWLTWPDEDGKGAWLIVGIKDSGVTVGSDTFHRWHNLASDGAAYSTDRKTWHPCTVTEDQP